MSFRFVSNRNLLALSNSHENVIAKIIEWIVLLSMRVKVYYTYIMTNPGNRVLYVGVTSDLIKRAFQHRKKLIKGFTSRYNCVKLVYYEIFDFADLAIKRETYLKNLTRARKISLIVSFNPSWQDLVSVEGAILLPRQLIN